MADVTLTTFGPYEQTGSLSAVAAGGSKTFEITNPKIIELALRYSLISPAPALWDTFITCTDLNGAATMAPFHVGGWSYHTVAGVVVGIVGTLYCDADADTADYSILVKYRHSLFR